jgi:outer membrane immunogenic protein
VKAGAAADNTMMYLLGGYAIADYDLLRDDSDIWDLSGTHSGFVVGTGIEQAFTPNLSGRIEATYMGIGGDTSVSPTSNEPYRGAAQDVAVTAGVNYYLGGHSMGTGALAPANWAGFSAGLDGLFAYHQGAIFDVDYQDHGGTYTVPSFGAGAGLHAGYDWQDDTFVYGAIADIAFFTNDESDTAPGYRTISSSLNWMGTVRGRAGVATGQALFYATGGIAFGDADLAYEYLPAPDSDSTHFDSSRIGWTVGLGVEKTMSDRSSFRLETLYTRFGEESAFSDVPAGNTCSNGFGSGPCRMLGYDDTITVKVGYSLRWDGM